MAKSVTARPEHDDKDARVLKLRSTASDAPLQDHAGHIDLFPVDMKDALKRERAEAEQEKRKKEKAIESQFTMRFSSAAGRDGVSRPWYAAVHSPKQSAGDKKELSIYEGFVNKDVWGNEDPRRKEREQARISTNDPFAFMQKAQAQLKKSKQDRKQWAEERSRELMELRSAQEREDRRSRHLKRKRRDVEDSEHGTPKKDSASSRHKHRHTSPSHSRDKREPRTSTHSRDRHEHRSSHRSGERRAQSKSRERAGDRHTHRHQRTEDFETAFI
jgi:hypothetical protein